MDNISLFFSIFNLNGHYPILDKLMIFGATDLIYLTFLVIFILAFKGSVREKKAVLLIILGLPIAILLIKAIHLFIFEPRPFIAYHFPPIVPETTYASFPSRHATIAAVIAFSYTYLKSKLAPLFLFIMIWVGLSRIYVGVHYPLDILGGFGVGILSLMLAAQMKNLLKIGFLGKSLKG